MNLSRFEVGIVSADSKLVDFYAEVFELERQQPLETSAGMLHRLESPGAVIKIMVPSVPPKPTSAAHLSETGLRYLTMWVTDFDLVLERCTARGAGLVAGPFTHEGTRLALLTDPIGNPIEVLES